MEESQNHGVITDYWGLYVLLQLGQSLELEVYLYLTGSGNIERLNGILTVSICENKVRCK